MCKSHAYGCPWISRCSANSFPPEWYPITFHECSERWPLSCWWVTAEQNFHFIHQSSAFHCATASIKTTDLKTCSDGLNKSNQDLNESICLPGFLLFPPCFSCPEYSLSWLFQPIFSICCVWFNESTFCQSWWRVSERMRQPCPVLHVWQAP